MGPADTGAELLHHHQAERLSHALYGLIIITATLGAERAHITDVTEAVVLLLSTALVLLLAHTYSAIMAERTVEGRRLGAFTRRMIVVDNIPVLGAVAVPLLLFGLVGMGLMELQMAYRGAIAFSLAALFAIGVYQGRVASMGWLHSIISGVGAGAIGLLVVLIEAFFD